MIVVLADDFTGAAELAGVAFQLDCSVEVQTEFQPSDAEVVVIDMATRALPADDATKRARMFARSLQDVGRHDIYVKIDSVLRGPIVPQLTAIAKELGKMQTLIVNANPKNRRTVHDGVMYVDDKPITETDFAGDPEHPAISDNVLDLLGLDASNAAVITPGDDWSDRSFLVGNVAEQSHLDWFEQNIPGQTIMAGGADFFETVYLQRYVHWKELESDDRSFLLRLIPGTLIVVGSAIDWNKRKQRCEELSIPIINFADDASTFTQRIHDALQANPTVMAAISCDRLPTDHALKLRDDLVKAVQEIITTQQLSQLIIEGGGTATDIIQKCGWSEMSVGACYAQGVVALTNQEAPGLRIVVKPGSYKWPEELF